METIITAAVGIILGIGAVWKYVSKSMAVLKEAGELLIAINTALEDQKLTKEEIEEIAKAGKEVIEAVKKLTKK